MDDIKTRPTAAAVWPMLLIAACTLIASIVRPAAGGQVAGLYQAEVPVADRGSGERRRGLRQALGEVAVRVSGERGAARNPVVGEALREPDAYVQQFGYTTLQRPGGTPGALPADVLHLSASFDSREVDRLLGEAGLPVWGRTRPTIVVWIASEAGGVRELLGADDTTGAAGAARAGARRRGIPLLLPLLDLEDRAALDGNDVWAGSRAIIEAASARYESDGTLVGRAFQVLPTVWEVRWTLMLSGGEREWSTRGQNLPTALAGGVDELADVLASRYAGAALADSTAGLAVRVSGVDTLEQYARTLDYIGSLDVVTRIDVVRVEPGAVVFNIDARGGGSTVRQVIGLGQVLAVDDMPGDPATLAFRLAR